ncbi:NAD(P)/FAD-dependent oxidoreductase [Conexibacter sp. SYSU D00693]|uniref:NAD(P)/FAD-dependent oxidoreductase n=1 Tax=Conexibacter sp. SYSU D00693 TaxID=2812560 RepID=UPI00196B12A7|nr:FAD-dependent oxidoreductase [Conexibacter sp. SYSU D00693]
MDLEVDHLVVGGGIAGLSCAQELRERGAQGRVLLVTRELDAPYDRTAVSKGCLAGEVAADELALRPAGWYAEQGIELATRAPVLRLDPVERTATLADRRTVRYGTALLATGAMVRRLRCPGADLAGVHHLRAPANAAAVRRELEDGVRDVVLVGGSYVGCEVAATLAAQGLRPHVVLLESAPFETHLGAGLGTRLARLLEARGITFHPRAEVVALEGDERVAGVRLADGRLLAAQLVVAGIGATPDVTLARAAGLALGETGGIRCDAALRVEGADGLFAAGDACEWDSVLHGGRARIEHWEVAAAQGRAAARGMLGDPQPFREQPTFWSDLGDDLVVRFAGTSTDGRASVVEERADGAFAACFVRDGQVVGTLTAGIDAAPDVRDAAVRVA